MPDATRLFAPLLRRGPRADLRRLRAGSGEDGAGQARVTNTELFFDLVFVFAVTQLSHILLPHPDAGNAAEALLLFGAVWWNWIDTSWVTNWLDPDRPAVRIMLLALMAGGLVLAGCLPLAFGGRGLGFALAYAAMQVGRPLFMVWALGPHGGANLRNFQRISLWAMASAVFWLLGGLLAGEARFLLWLLALALDLGSAWAGFWVPGLGRSTTADWDVDGAHLAERCGGFVLIALGESITVTGAAFSGATWSPSLWAAFAAAFIGTAAMWWLYFDRGAEHGSRHIATAADPGRIARIVYTYLHAVIVAAVILGAVADELAMAAPHALGAPMARAVVLAAPALYLLGSIGFKGLVAGRLPLSHLVGLALLALAALAGGGFGLLALNGMTSLLLVIVALWEWRSYARGPRPAARASVV
ncbi:low temperature requirement protein A [Acidisoma sp. C75]